MLYKINHRFLLCLFLPLVVFTSQLAGQDLFAEVDSIQQVIDTSPPDSLQKKIRLHKDIAWLTIYADTERAIQSVDDALELAYTLSDPRELGGVFYWLQLITLHVNDFEKSLSLADSAIYYYKKANDKIGLAEMSLSKAILLNYVGKYNQAYIAAISAINQFETLGKFEKANNAKLELAVTLDQLEEYEQAKGLYDEYFAYLYRQPDTTLLADPIMIGLLRYGLHNSMRKNHAAALDVFHKILRKARQLEMEYHTQGAIPNIGWQYAKLSQYDSAKVYCQNGLEHMSKSETAYGMAYCSKCLGYIALQENQLDSAEYYLQRAYTLSNEINVMEEVLENTELLALLYEKKEDYRLAHYFAQENKALHDSSAITNKSHQLALLQTQFEAAAEERTNSLLKTELEFQAQQSFNYRILGILSILLGALSLFFIRQRQKSKPQLERKVTEKTEDIQIANQELKEFAYITSHDMREPIRSIHSFARLAERRLKKEQLSDVKDYLGIISKSSIQLDNLVNDVYSFIKIEESVLEKKTFNLHDALDDVTTDLALQIQEKKAEIDFGPAVDITTNFSLLKIILKNLLENGLKYNTSEVPKIKVHAELTHDYYNISISDNGIGIEADYQEYVFLMFKRLHHRGDYPGSGLGLSICKKIVLQLGGHIKVAGLGLEQKGTTFTFTIKQ